MKGENDVHVVCVIYLCSCVLSSGIHVVICGIIHDCMPCKVSFYDTFL